MSNVSGVKEAGSWTTAFVNNLPDLSFALIKSGSVKDKEGKTVPRDLRMLPHHGESVSKGHSNASVDFTHLRNALARVSQSNTSLSETERERATRHLEGHAKALKVDAFAEGVAETAHGDESVYDRESRIYADFRAALGSDYDSPWITDLLDDGLVARDKTGRYYKYPMAEDADGKFTFGTPIEVRKVYVPVAVTAEALGEFVNGLTHSGAESGKDLSVASPGITLVKNLLESSIPGKMDLARLLQESGSKMDDASVRMVHTYLHYASSRLVGAHAEAAKLFEGRKMVHEPWDAKMDEMPSTSAPILTVDVKKDTVPLTATA